MDNYDKIDYAADQALGFVILSPAGFVVIDYLSTLILLPLIRTTSGTEVH